MKYKKRCAPCVCFSLGDAGFTLYSLTEKHGALPQDAVRVRTKLTFRNTHGYQSVILRERHSV